MNAALVWVLTHETIPLKLRFFDKSLLATYSGILNPTHQENG
jgi:hypothetical protein